jgi:opacity protein-like surface antigen
MRQRVTMCPAALVLALTCCALAASRPAAASQAGEPSIGYNVRVTVGEAPVFAQADARSPLVGRARSGDLLVVVGKENAWYKVRLPRDRRLSPTGPISGYIEARLVVISGPGGAIREPAGSTSGTARPLAGTGARGWGALQLRPFGEAAFQSFTARQSFKAIFSSSTGFLFGGGVDLALARSLRLSVGVTHFQKTGERAFAFNGEAFQLGVPDRVSMTPITINLVYRFKAKRFTPYVGGGAGAVVYRETADFAEAGDNISKTGSAFQALAGVEFPMTRGISAALEGQYQGVRGILGDTGVSQAFSEKDLGGASVRVRLIFGR